MVVNRHKSLSNNSTQYSEVGQAVGQMHLDRDQFGFHAGQGAAIEDGETHKGDLKINSN